MKTRTEIRMPGLPNQKVAVTGEDNTKYQYLLDHYNLRPTELVRMLIRKEFDKIFVKK